MEGGFFLKTAVVLSRRRGGIIAGTVPLATKTTPFTANVRYNLCTMTAMSKTSPLPQPSRPSVPPLENGDSLTRAEFERRYRAMPEGIKAELIE